MKKVLMIGSYEKIEDRKGRLEDIAVLLDGLIDTECLLYDHKGMFNIHTFGRDAGNIQRVVDAKRREIANISCEEDDDYLIEVNAEHEVNSFEHFRAEDGGGFIVRSESELVESFIEWVEPFLGKIHGGVQSVPLCKAE